MTEMKYFVQHEGVNILVQTERLTRTTFIAPFWQERTSSKFQKTVFILPADHWSLVVRPISKKNIGNHAYRPTNTYVNSVQTD